MLAVDWSNIDERFSRMENSANLANVVSECLQWTPPIVDNDDSSDDEPVVAEVGLGIICWLAVIQ